MYGDWITILDRDSVTYFDSNSICANGELFERRFILRGCGDASLQEDNDRTVGFWPRWMANAAQSFSMLYGVLPQR